MSTDQATQGEVTTAGAQAISQAFANAQPLTIAKVQFLLNSTVAYETTAIRLGHTADNAVSISGEAHGHENAFSYNKIKVLADNGVVIATRTIPHTQQVIDGTSVLESLYIKVNGMNVAQAIGATAPVDVLQLKFTQEFKKAANERAALQAGQQGFEDWQDLLINKGVGNSHLADGAVDSRALAQALLNIQNPVASVIESYAANPPNEQWMFCHGQILIQADYPELTRLITPRLLRGSNIHLPDRRGRVSIGAGQGAGLTTNRTVGEQGGEEKHRITSAESDPHDHYIVAAFSTRAEFISGSQYYQGRESLANIATHSDDSNYSYFLRSSSNMPNRAQSSTAGGGQPMSLMQPDVGANFFIRVK